METGGRRHKEQEYSREIDSRSIPFQNWSFDDQSAELIPFLSGITEPPVLVEGDG